MSEDEKIAYKRFEVWLDERGQETLEQLRARFGATHAGAIRAALELIRGNLPVNPDK